MDDMFSSLLGPAQSPAAAQSAAPAQASGGFDPNKSYGTPSKLLDNLTATESSGNPLAVNKTTQAMGPYQFTPSTLAMLRQQGMKFDPFDPVQARNAADYYIQQLKQQNGGTYQGALKAYGGFVKQDPTQYINKVMAGVPTTAAQPQPASQPAQPAQATAAPSDDMFSVLLDPKPARSANDKPAPAVPAQQAAAPAQPGGVTSFLAGVGRGVQESALGAQQLLGHGLQAAGAQTAGNWLVNDANQGLQRGAAEVSPYQAAHPTATGVGTFAGNVAATAPLGGAIGPGSSLLGMAAKGALGGALGAAVATPVDPDSQNYWADKGKQTAIGAATGGVAGPALGALGKAISPEVSQDVQTLLNKGVTPTPGQILGGGFARTEDKLTSVPVLGDMIKNAQGRALSQFNVAAYNDALAPIGQTFDSTAAKVGQEGIAQVKSKIQDVYNSVLPNMKFQADPQFQQEVTQLGSMVQGLPDAQQKTFMKVLQNQFGKMGPNGQMDGQTLKGVAEELGDKASGYLGDGSFDNRQLGAAISALKNSFMDGVKRSSPPELASSLSNADTAWANFARLRAAGATTGAANNEGVFTAAQLQNAVRSGDKSAGKGAFATGNALMQDLSGAGQRVLGSKYPDSGTAGRGLLALLAPGGVAAGLATAPGSTLAALGGIGLGSLPYTSAGQRGVATLLTARPQFAAPVANAVKGLAPWVIPGGSAALLSK